MVAFGAPAAVSIVAGVVESAVAVSGFAAVVVDEARGEGLIGSMTQPVVAVGTSFACCGVARAAAADAFNGPVLSVISVKLASVWVPDKPPAEDIAQVAVAASTKPVLLGFAAAAAAADAAARAAGSEGSEAAAAETAAAVF